jgi:hypothetical protein
MELLFDPQKNVGEQKPLPAPAALERYICPWAAVAYREFPFGNILIQELRRKKISIYIWRVYANSPTNLYPVCDHPTIALQFTLVGDIPCVLSGFGNKLLEQSRYELFYVPESINKALFQPGLSESIHFEISSDFLEDIADNDPMIKELLERFNAASKEGKPMFTANINYAVNNILQNLRNCDLKGGRLNLEVQKFTLELLSEYFMAITEAEMQVSLLPIASHQKLLLQVRDSILLNPNIGCAD